jgi:RNA polymerase-binding transcription factor DksA
MDGLPCPLVEERYETNLARSAAVLNAVDRALDRLSEGTYGRCETCGAPVLDSHLERDPTQCLCEQHLSLDETAPPPA